MPATRILTGEDGESHKQLRDIMRSGYSKESIKGRYNELVTITDGALKRDWPVGTSVSVLPAMSITTGAWGVMGWWIPVAWRGFRRRRTRPRNRSRR